MLAQMSHKINQFFFRVTSSVVQTTLDMQGVSPENCNNKQQFGKNHPANFSILYIL